MVAFNFPPYNVIGAIRAGKLAKFLHQRGHDLRVLTAAPQVFPATLPCEVPEHLVTRTSWLNLNHPFERATRQLAGGSGTLHVAGHGRFATRAVRAYRAVVGLPDMQIGWAPRAI